MQNPVELRAPAQRIVSLVPSQTELLHDLGLGDRVVGITKFCIHPEQWFRDKPRIGGTKNVHTEAIRALRPDLIIGNKEENVREQVEALREVAPVYLSDVNTLEEALQMIGDIGKLTATQKRAGELIGEIRERFEALRTPARKKTVAYFIWKDPWMIAGKDTFIDAMLAYAGFENCTSESRYPEFQPEKMNPEVILLSTEPFPFSEEHVQEVKQRYPGKTVLIVDGELFSWYGSRLLKSADYFKELQTRLNR